MSKELLGNKLASERSDSSIPADSKVQKLQNILNQATPPEQGVQDKLGDLGKASTNEEKRESNLETNGFGFDFNTREIHYEKDGIKNSFKESDAVDLITDKITRTLYATSGGPNATEHYEMADKDHSKSFMYTNEQFDAMTDDEKVAVLNMEYKAVKHYCKENDDISPDDVYKAYGHPTYDKLFEENNLPEKDKTIDMGLEKMIEAMTKVITDEQIEKSKESANKQQREIPEVADKSSENTGDGLSL